MIPPPIFWRILAALALIAAIFAALQLYVHNAVVADRNEARADALTKGKQADDMAGQIAASTAATIQQENDDARQAAARSDDPLADGLRSLRANKGRADQASR
ncbi:hypothetical protein [Novosphingobium olei]|uniref:Uncharacterized protein n=1 Tax=Novosphingobium olei TaxID=2728851 RepID=A0A7Y0GA80_9SPHN|nr:hypothetical protein [Novosphingobium olei]NML93818.1 hypothetical protein [Novosphingobium olei]